MALALQPGPRIGAVPQPSPTQWIDEEGVAPQPQRPRLPQKNITKLESSLAVQPASVVTADQALKAALKSVETSGPLPHPGGASNIAYAVTSGQTHPSWHHDTQSAGEAGIAPNVPRLVGVGMGGVQSAGQSIASTASRAASSTAAAAEQAGSKVATIVQTATKDTQSLPLPAVQPVLDVAAAAVNAVTSGAANLANAIQASLPGMRDSLSAALGFAEEEIAPQVSRGSMANVCALHHCITACSSHDAPAADASRLRHETLPSDCSHRACLLASLLHRGDPTPSICRSVRSCTLQQPRCSPLHRPWRLRPLREPGTPPQRRSTPPVTLPLQPWQRSRRLCRACARPRGRPLTSQWALSGPP